MGLRAATYRLEWDAFNCGGCGLDWAVDSRWADARRRDGVGFVCPNGCNRVFADTPDKRKIKELEAHRDRLQREKVRAETYARTNRLEAEEAKKSAASYKGHFNRVKRKTRAGVCPVEGCKRHFKDLYRHVQSKHPTYREEPV